MDYEIVVRTANDSELFRSHLYDDCFDAARDTFRMAQAVSKRCNTSLEGQLRVILLREGQTELVVRVVAGTSI